ncbi:MAG: GNAT family N-acetyltransferase [Chloroflexota bacterium]
MLTFRPGHPGDARAAFDVFEPTIDHLSARVGGTGNATAGDPAAWDRRRPLFEHLGATGDQFWFAEEDSRVVGYARSIVRGNVRELTEFFVLPDAQGGGIGRGLIERALPMDGLSRTIIATAELPAIARYLKAGIVGRFPIYAFTRAPEVVQAPTDLKREPLTMDAATLDELALIDEPILEFRRDVDHRWLAGQRRGTAYRRAGRIVAYGYHPTAVGWGGPFAAERPADLPVLLADAETAAAEAGQSEIAFDVPLVNAAAVAHLVERGYRLDPFHMLFLSDREPGRFERYVLCGPPFFA